jgi:ubiquinone/menaquinone biosynthesis C-methylase UbiE
MMLRVARASTFAGHVTWRSGVAEAVPLDDAQATVLWSIATVHHWRDMEAGLGEARRVLADGGRLLAIERRRRAGATGHASHGWTEEQAAAFVVLAESAGFTDLEVSTEEVRRGTLLAVRGRRS